MIQAVGSARWRLFVVAVISLVIAGAHPGAQQTSREERAAIWRGAVEHHNPGHQDNEIAFVASWPRADLDAAWADTRRALDPSLLPAFVRRAVLLHTDILVFYRKADGYDISPDGPAVAVIVDGTQVATKSAGTSHWEFARTLLDSLRGPADDPLVLAWYRATTAMATYWLDWPECGRQVARFKSRFASDAVMALYEGTMHETLASPSIQAVFESSAPPDVSRALPLRAGGLPVFSPSGTRQWDVGTTDSELKQAETLFRRALTLDRNLPEARVRLGHVLARRGRHAEAITELEPAVAEATSDLIRFWGLMWLARERMATGALVGAREALTEASRLYPRAETPRLGLSQLAFDAGRRNEALDAFRAIVLPRETLDESDPWLTYEFDHSPDVRELMDAMIKAFQSA
jgi:tetratricopeptide (TPR) repeat protein